MFDAFVQDSETPDHKGLIGVPLTVERGMRVMKKSTGITIIAVTVMFLTVGLLYAQGGPDAEAFGKPECREKSKPIVKALGLTPEQEKGLEENRQAQHQQMTKIVEALKVQKQELEQALKDYSVTRPEVEPIVTTIKSLQAQLIDQRISGIFAAKEILTPEQFVKFQELVKQHKGGKMQGPGFGRQPHGKPRWMPRPDTEGQLE